MNSQAPRSAGFPRFSLAWRFALDEDYLHARISEEHWRSEVEAFNAQGTSKKETGQ